MQADSWCPLCGADRAIVAWCPRCANALGIAQPVNENATLPEVEAALGHNPTHSRTGTTTVGLQSPSNTPPPKNSALKIVPKKSGGPKVEPHALKPSVLRHRDKMREYMRRRREEAKALKRRQPIDPNIVHPGVADANPSPEEEE